MNMKTSFFVLKLIFQQFHSVVGSHFDNESLKSMTCYNNGICFSEDYDKNKIPSKPINIDVTISIVQINQVDDLHATVDIKAWITSEWKDHRITSRNHSGSRDGGYLTGHLLNTTWLEKLWTPDIYFYRLKAVDFSGSRKTSVGSSGELI